MDATEYLVHEATYHLHWWAKHHPDYIHPPSQGTLIDPNSSEKEGMICLRTAVDAIRVTIPLHAKNFFPGESSDTKAIMEDLF
jgi:hypothetical protein